MSRQVTKTKKAVGKKAAPVSRPSTTWKVAEYQLEVNDDEEEKNRRKSTAAPKAQAKLTNAQITALLSDVIKMSTSNKITQNNCWSLQLTENLPEILESNQNNFQTAASAIDASVKIFAARVDSVHQETYKLQSGLNRTDNSGGGRAPEGAGEGGAAEEEEERARPARRKTRMASTLVKHEGDLDSAALELQFEEDPLIKKAALAFDSGGSQGLLLNQLGIYAGCTIVFDSGDAPQDAGRQCRDEDPRARLEPGAELGEQFRQLLSRMRGAEMCPEVDSYKSNAPLRRADDGLQAQLEALPPAHESQPAPAPSQPSQAAPDMEPVPFSQVLGDEEPYGGGLDDYGGGGGIDYDLDDDAREFDADGNIVASPAGAGAPPAPERTVTQTRPGLVMQEAGALTDEMVKHLLSGQDEQGYFKPKAANWMGPENWNFKVGPKMTRVAAPAAAGEGDDDEGGGSGASKTRKKRGEQQYFIDFTKPSETDWDAAFAPPKRGGTKLTKGSRDKAKTLTTTLPTDVHYAPNMLLSLFTKPKWMIPKEKANMNWRPIVDPAAQGQTGMTMVMEVDEQVPAGATDWFDNNHDDAGQMPMHGSNMDDEPAFEFDDDDDGFGDMMDMPVATSRKSMLPGGPMVYEVGGVQRDFLVAEPQQVEQIQLGFARVARAVDVKTLKASIWRGLATTTSATPGGDRRVSAVPAQPQSFQELLEELPARVPRYEQSNVSIPFCFISLLHLCNERGLELETNGLDQLTIIPGAAGVIPTPARPSRAQATPAH